MATVAFAQEHPGEHPAAEAAPKIAPISIGDKAPAVKVAKYFKGTPVKSFEPGKTYVMEFWATWCGPCLAQIPHLAAMQKTWADKDVQMVSTAVWQREKTQAAREKKVGDFVADQGDAMAYTVAIDDEGWMAEHWMTAAGQRGIPTAFLVGTDGIIQWIGHPAALDSVLEKYKAGTWDLAAAKAEFDEERRFDEKGRALMQRIILAERAGDREAAAAAIAEAAAEFPGNLNVQMMQFEFFLADASTAAEAYEVGREIMKKGWDDASMLNYLAWHVATDKTVARRDLDFALEAAQRADELTDNSDASILDTVARVYWEMGDKDKAIAIQTKAVAAAEEHSRGELEATLASYQSPE
jgi:thiol-disulfide isomerase/thioredoxin